MRDNNLNFLRLVGASLVLYGHSFVFLDLPEARFLSWLPMGPLGVFIFFTISGFLITASWDKDPHLVRFLARRCLRIFPALIVCILLSVFVLGPLLTSLSLKEYFANQHTWGYLRNIFLYISYYLPGVFESNRVPNAVNGSLWTLPIEFSLYFMVAIVGVFQGNRWVTLLLAIISSLVTLFWAQQSPEMLVVYASDVRQVFICGTFFWVGAVFYKFNLQRFFSTSLMAVSIILMICLESNTKLLATASWILLPTAVLTFGLTQNKFFSWLTQHGDYSYGIYIYAFPIQQTVATFNPNIELGSYLATCFFLTLFCAMCSWHFIENPALKLKPRKR